MIDLGELKKQNKKFKYTLLFSYLLFATFILIAIYLLHVKYSANESLKHLYNEVKKEASYKERIFNDFFKKNNNVVNALSNNKILIDFIRNGLKDDTYVTSLFKAIMQSNSNYMQLRYINKQGQEIIRFDRYKIDGQPRIIPKKLLQNKKERYYYKECCKIKKDEIWYSKIDLNVEHKKIEIPIKPVIRIAKQIYLNNEFKGFVIINIFMKPYLKEFSESSFFDVYLTDFFGNFIIHKDQKKNWSKYFNKNINATRELGIDLKVLQNTNVYFDKKRKYFIQPLTYGKSNSYRLIYFENAKKVNEIQNTIKKRVIITVLFAILIAIPFAYLASSPAKKIYQSLYQKSNDITKLANNLESRVEEEVLKNLKKDKILENQSKLAALGEMIGNIAHQWRHPITRVSLILQNIKTFKEHGKLDDEHLERYINNALEQMDFMSQTIDDFKNFYKPDNNISIFHAKIAISSAHKIIGGLIKHQGIDISINIKNDFKIKGYPNQFAQVILNIMNNAREALEEKRIEKPFIKINLFSEDNVNKITIEDNAGGISINNLEKIFDAYFTTKKENGTGIGLYMSRMIIMENFNGKLYAKNAQQGALFTIELPKV
ncbi:sensor histidine kinase [Sulfurospirillum sp. 1307]